MIRSSNPSHPHAVPTPRRPGAAPSWSGAAPALRRLGPAVLLLLIAVPSAAQQWNSPRVLSLVQRATERREAQLSDTGLVEYQAVAKGYLTFLVQLGQGYPTPPKIVRTDQLALQVYWRSPDLSKQRIIGRRDTTLLPTDINYHRDHLGIIQNNFPDIIRLGEGDEVRDCPHPLSPIGLQLYDFAIADSLRLSIPGQTFDVYEVKVRPKDDTQPRVVGAVYLDRTTGQVVRMALSFTRAAMLDPQLEDISIVLENGLIGTRFWLPRHQEIEIRRTGTWFDYPVRGIIRGRWEVSDYKLNVNLPVASFAGPEFVQEPPQVLKAYPFKGNILDSLPPDVTVTTDADVRRVQAEARALVRRQALERAEATRVSARGVSDMVRVNRVQGLTLGAGIEQRVGPGLTLAVRPNFGIDERRLRGELSLGWQAALGASVHLFARRVLADARLEPERSGIANSLAAQEFGGDATEPYDVLAAGASVEAPMAGLRWTLSVAAERQRAAHLYAQPATGRYAPTIAATAYSPLHAALRIERDGPLDVWGFDVRAAGQADWNHARGHSVCPAAGAPCVLAPDDAWRLSGVADVQRSIGRLQFVSHTDAGASGASGGDIPAQQLIYFGGPVTAPGYGLHELVGTRGASQRFELRMPVPFYAFSLGTFGRSPAQATLAPFVNLVGLDPLAASSVAAGVARTSRFYPSAGVGLIGFFDLVRLDVAKGLREDGRWTFSVDVTRAFWGIL